VSLIRRRFNASLVAAAVLALIGTCPATAQSPWPAAPAQDVDVAELAKPVPLGDIVLGSANAPVTMIEYASLSCGHCAAFHESIWPIIKAEYIDTGKVRLIFREYPLDVKAAAASMVARCVSKGDAEKYHAAANKLFATQDKWVQQDTAEQLQRTAGELGLDEAAFNTCLADQAMVDGLKLGMAVANTRFKVDSTPTFFINGTPLRGAYPIGEFRRMIEAKLKS
jgi:protein-disulfide isomerase